MRNTVYPLQVYPRIPPAIERLEELASNFWFSWNPAARWLFSRLDESLWGRTDNNPKLFLRCVDQGILERAADDEAFVSSYRKVMTEFDAYVEQGPLPYKPGGLGEGDLIAYFCAEYGFHESFPIYSGGLGILAGDHCKTASDMRLPFVAVGLLYGQGYFNQHIDRHGQQIPEYVHIDPQHTPLRLALTEAGEEVRITCPFPDRAVAVRVWRADVGRVPILLLDTDVPENVDMDRQITHVLYGGDRALRLQQEAVLGVGGARALRALGYAPSVWHINEGHAAFLILERLRELTTGGLPFAVALEAVAADTIFTTHTPVAAGHDVFPADLIAKHFQSYLAELRIDEHELLRLGMGEDESSTFNMTRLALNGARSVNGVSRIHGRVSAELCRSAWPDVPPLENPVGFVTNGTHLQSFMRQPWVDLLDQHLGPAWHQNVMDRSLMEQIQDIPDDRFWDTNQRVKGEMLRVLRDRLARQHTRNGLSEAHIHRLSQLVDPDNPNVLTVGFARRFATYKRSTLLFTDLRWLETLLRNEERPVLFLFAGKAHPADEPGQWMMREIQRISNQAPFVGKVLLLEGYDAGLSRSLTSGVDIWLNTPIYPFEASGTSGMKAAINGTVNLSVLDGWWAEGYDGDNGWAIPPSIHNEDVGERDRQDAVALYEILQDEVIPLYYARDSKPYSPDWVAKCKRSMASVLPRFNSQRVLHDYARLFYGPAAKQGKAIAANGHRIAHELADWKARVRARWPGVQMRSVDQGPAVIGFNEAVQVEVDVTLNGLRPEDVRVECVLHRKLCSELTVPVQGYADNRRPQNGLTYIGDETAAIWPFEPQTNVDAGADVCRYRLEYRPPWAGAMTYEVRAVPQHPALSHVYELGLMRWL